MQMNCLIHAMQASVANLLPLYIPFNSLFTDPYSLSEPIAIFFPHHPLLVRLVHTDFKKNLPTSLHLNVHSCNPTPHQRTA